MSVRALLRALGWVVSELIPSQAVACALSRDYDRAVGVVHDQAEALAEAEAEEEVWEPQGDKVAREAIDMLNDTFWCKEHKTTYSFCKCFPHDTPRVGVGALTRTRPITDSAVSAAAASTPQEAEDPVAVPPTATGSPLTSPAAVETAHTPAAGEFPTPLECGQAAHYIRAYALEVLGVHERGPALALAQRLTNTYELHR